MTECNYDEIKNEERINMVREFHDIFGHDNNHLPQYDLLNSNNEKKINFRISLIEEEINELIEAHNNKNLSEMIDAFCDILYVCYGTLITYGMKIEMGTINKNMNEIDFEELRILLEKIKEDKYNFNNVNQLILEIIYKIIKSHDILMNKTIHNNFIEVHKSNMSKVCENEEDAIESVKKYSNHEKYKNVGYRISNNKKYYIIYDKDTNKILKNYKFELPKLDINK